ncbi:serine protease [Streptomyces sp. NBC_00237]|uniref:S1 family peptidase n=1 Tax=Streptomyces sp. NBC_00237 TaxID=2975687 RepID=UPI00225136B1|nr:serine protease [Streptomyces sp. NBC_00237]MCX5203675.1 serine protease [Streptomyces sp. NBC_00237]
MSSRPPDAMVSIRRAQSYKSSGAGVLLGGGMVLTCAHVVNDALGRASFEQRHPGDAEVTVEIPGSSIRQGVSACVQAWIPPAGEDGSRIMPGEDEYWLGDLSVLRLDQYVDDMVPPAPRYSAMQYRQRVRAWHGSGTMSSFADATISAMGEAVAFVDGDSTGMAIGPGYSGGPLCRMDDGDVVGLVAAHYMPDPNRPHSPQHLIRRSWVIPWQRIERDLHDAGVHLLSRVVSPRPSYENDHAYHPLMTAYERFVPNSSRAHIAHAVARSCDMVVGTAMDGPGEFAAFLLEHPRAVAALSAILLGGDPAAARAVLEAGRLSLTPLLLAPSEHKELLRLVEGAFRC